MTTKLIMSRRSVQWIVRTALLGVVPWALGGSPAFAQTTCTTGQTISGQVIADVLVVEAGTGPGRCTVSNSKLLEGALVVTGELRTNNSTVVFGAIEAEPGTVVTIQGSSRVFGIVATYQAASVTVADSRIAEGVDAKEGGAVSVTNSTLGGIKAEKTASINASNNLLGDKVEVKEVAGSVMLSGNTGNEVLVEKATGNVTVSTNTAFSTIKITGNTGVTTSVTGNFTPKLECSNNAGLTQSGNVALENLCTN